MPLSLQQHDGHITKMRNDNGMQAKTYYYVAFEDIMMLMSMSVVRRCSQTLRNDLAGVRPQHVAVAHRCGIINAALFPFVALSLPDLHQQDDILLGGLAPVILVDLGL